jgi:hypothetical protein
MEAYMQASYRDIILLDLFFPTLPVFRLHANVILRQKQ